MKTIILGDTHGKSLWKLAINQESPDKVVFIGDYFDTHDNISAVEQIHNFKEILQYKKDHSEVVLLIGNHDHHYFPEIGYTGTSGYQRRAAKNIEFIINENRDQLIMAHSFDNILCTHAGVSEEWMNLVHSNENFEEPLPTGSAEIAAWVNSIWKYKPRYFQFNGVESSGNDTYQTPIWIRPGSLVRASKNLKNSGIVQVVGHTQVREINLEGANELGLYCIDALGTSREYLIIENQTFTIGFIK